MSVKNIIEKKQLDFFLVFVTVSFYLLNTFIFKKIHTGIFHYFFVCYFNDLICPIGFLAYVNIMLSFVNKKLDGFLLILTFCLACGLVWEFVAPLLKGNSVTDLYDLLCYCVGGTLYYAVNKSIKLYKRRKDH